VLPHRRQYARSELSHISCSVSGSVTTYRGGQARAAERVHESEGLDSLLRVAVVAVGLVVKSSPGPTTAVRRTLRDGSVPCRAIVSSATSTPWSDSSDVSDDRPRSRKTVALAAVNAPAGTSCVIIGFVVPPTLSPLFEPFLLRDLPLNNRIVMAPMTRRRADRQDCPTSLFAEYYAQRARAGLIIGEATAVSPGGRSYPGSPGIYGQAHVDAWRAVVDAVHARSGRLFLQLWHAGRFSDPAFLNGRPPVAPSALAIRGELTVDGERKAFAVPRALTRSELPGIVGSFADAARRAREAGFDGVEVHAAQGYLLDEFLRDGTNRRDDDYGGAITGRARLLLEVVGEVARGIGASRVGVQLSPTSRLGDMSDSDPVSTFGYTAEKLSAFGLAYLHVFEPPDSTLRVSPTLRAAFRGPMIANGGYDAPTAAAAIARGEADLVSFGRPFIANPDLVERFAEHAALATPDPSTFYGGGAHGYTDYPTRHGTIGSTTKPTASNDA